MQLDNPTNRFQLESLEARRLLNFALPVDYNANAYTVLAADFNGDGRLDLAAGDKMLLGNGDGTFQAAQTSGTGLGGVRAVAADLNGDGKIDLVEFDGYALNLRLGRGDGTFQTQTIVLPSQLPPGTGYYPEQAPTSVAVGDLNGDGKLDLIAGGFDMVEVVPQQYRFDAYVNVLLGNGDGTFRPDTVYFVSHSSATEVLAVGKFDGDGKSDILVEVNGDQAPVGGGYLSVFLGKGDGTLQPTPRTSAGYVTVRSNMPVADFDRDGKLDVLSNRIMKGNGDGTFLAGALWNYGGIGTAVIGDVNADGKLDIVGTHTEYEYDDDGPPTTTCSAPLLLGDGNGAFAAAATLSLGIFPHNAFGLGLAALADFDRDGFPDLAVPEYSLNSPYDLVAVAHNDGNWATKTWIGPTSGGNWSTAANWSPSGVPAANDLVTISGKSVNLSASATFASLNLTGGASLAVASNGSRVLRTSTLFIDGNSKLDLNDNDLILDYSGVTPMSGVVSKIVQGRGASPTGIYSPQANDSGNQYALGAAEASQVLGISGTQTKLFAGQAVDATTVLVKFTYAGDANLDGKINVDDYGRIDFNVGLGVAGWFNGDFNYDGKINVDDYGIIDFNVGIQGPPLAGVANADVPAFAPARWDLFPRRHDSPAGDLLST